MPLYHYRCEICDTQVELFRSVADKENVLCDGCGTVQRKMPSAIALARISHQLPAKTANLGAQSPFARSSFFSVLPSTPLKTLGRKRSLDTNLRCFDSKAGENCGLATRRSEGRIPMAANGACGGGGGG